MDPLPRRRRISEARRLAHPRRSSSAVETLACGEEGDWARALALVGMLVRHAKHEGGIRADLATLSRASSRGMGTAPTTFAYTCRRTLRGPVLPPMGFFVRRIRRTWPHLRRGLRPAARERWAFVDVHNNVYAVLAGTDAPIDALSLRQALLARPLRSSSGAPAPGRLGFPHFDKLLDYYRRGAGEWYLWWGNDVITRDHRICTCALESVRSTCPRLGSAVGLPPLVVIVTADNEIAIARMQLCKGCACAVAILVALLALLVCLQLG